MQKVSNNDKWNFHSYSMSKSYLSVQMIYYHINGTIIFRAISIKKDLQITLGSLYESYL